MNGGGFSTGLCLSVERVSGTSLKHPVYASAFGPFDGQW